MNYNNNSANSVLSESLDFLIPPVKRDVFKRSIINSNLCGQTVVNDIQMVNKPRQYVIGQDQRLQTKIDSSTSLVLKRTTEKEIRQKYSILNFSTLLHQNNVNQNPVDKDKPLIKVTVIPKSTQTQVSKAFRKRKSITKKIQASVSDQDNAIQTKNIYLVVAGKKKEKFYEIKTTGSAKFSNDKTAYNTRDGELSLSEISNLQNLINSLDMDNKKKKKPKMDLNAHGSKSSIVSNDLLHNMERNVESRQSRIRITGRFGITNDERYVLKCSATVNEKSGIDLKPNLSSMSLIMNDERKRIDYRTIGCACEVPEYRDIRNTTRDINVQTGRGEIYAEVNNLPVKRSQGTQIESAFLAAKNPINDFNKDQNVAQCCCSHVFNKSPKVVSQAITESEVQGSSSPLVIISVYPKQNASDIVDATNSPTGRNSRQVSPVRKKVVQNSRRKEENQELNVRQKIRQTSRSPSPNRFVKKQTFNDKLIQTNVVVKSRNNSPNREAFNANSNKTTIRREIVKQTTDTKNRVKPQRESVQIQKPKVLNLKLNSQGTNTDHWQTKKALVDGYTKRLTAGMNEKFKESDRLRVPKDSISNVAINIDSDNEFYDVLFQKDKLTTGLTVRKTKKVAESHKAQDDKFNLRSKEIENKNFRPFTPDSSINEPTYHDTPLENCQSTLCVRDSIEIRQRKENKLSTSRKTCQNYQKDNEAQELEEKFSAPIKHYRGDACLIPDPVVRDKEIRELLGIERGRSTTTSKVSQAQATQHMDIDQLHPFYNDICQKNFRTAINFKKLLQTKTKSCSCQCTGSSEEIKSVNLDTKGQQSSSLDKIRTSGTQYESSDNNPLCQQLILNRNIQVFLQLEQFSKQKPIVLSRKQYNKVRKAIQTTVVKKLSQERRKRYPCKASIDSKVSIGEVRPKDKPLPPALLKDKILSKKVEHKKVEAKKVDPKKTSLEKMCENYIFQNSEKSKVESKKVKHKKIEPIKIVDSVAIDPRNVSLEEMCEGYTTQSTKKKKEFKEKDKKSDKGKSGSKSKWQDLKKSLTHVFPAETGTKDNTRENDIVKSRTDTRRTMSSVEVRFSSVAYMRQVTFSASGVEHTGVKNEIHKNESVSSNLDKDNLSLHTIFKGHKRSATPNLGTSIYSLYSEDFSDNSESKSLNNITKAVDAKSGPRPFFKRLMSCLVMRSTRASNVKLAPVKPEPKVPSINSSIDSYHISTSLGAVELSSSIYDTSASFYSNHTILPVNNKMKRGFFNSVRGFLAYRRS